MKDLLKEWEEVRVRLMAAPHLCILTDFDGTLVPFSADPSVPQLSDSTRKILESISRKARVSLGVVSGRALDDLGPRIGIPGIWYVGNHGYEMRSPKGEERRFYEAEDVEYIAQIRKELAEALSGIPGVILEHKGPILAVHYRAVETDRVGDVQRIFLGIIERHHHQVMIGRGDQVLEARTRSGANKGRAVHLIQREMPAGTLTVYFGDDVTDRDVFRELKGIGLSVEVGGADSGLAEYTLLHPESVTEILSRLLSELESRPSPSAAPPKKRRKKPE